MYNVYALLQTTTTTLHHAVRSEQTTYYIVVHNYYYYSDSKFISVSTDILPAVYLQRITPYHCTAHRT